MEAKTVLLLCNGIHYPRRMYHFIQTPRNYPEKSTKHSEHDESFKSRIYHFSHRKLLVLWNKMNEFLLYKPRNVRITQRWGEFMQPLLHWKSNKYYTFWVCICRLRYPAYNMHAPYCHLWSVRLYNILPLYLVNGTILKKKKNHEHKMCFDFLYNFCPKYFSP